MPLGKVWVVTVPDEIDQEFRKVILDANGGVYEKGILKKALLEAVHDYIRKKRQAQ